MKKKRTLIIALSVVILSIFGIIGIYRYLQIPKSTESILEYLKDIDGYSTDMIMEYKNSKQTITENCREMYLKNYGYRVELNDEKVLLFNKDKINFIDLKNGASYQTSEDFDEIYRYTFIKEYINLLYTDQKITTSKEVEGDIEYLKISLLMLRNNDNLYKGELFINSKTFQPYKLVIYNKKGEVTVTAKYNNFVVDKKLNKDLFSIRK